MPTAIPTYLPEPILFPPDVTAWGPYALAGLMFGLLVGVLLRVR